MMPVTAENTARFTYRVYRDSDMEGVLELWKEHSGWGAITEKQFTDWHIRTPYGPCLIIVGVDEEERIIGQMVFVPSRVYVDKSEKNAYRIMAPIIVNDIKGLDIRNYHHPAFAMFRLGIQRAKEAGAQAIYFIPSIGWLHGVKTLHLYDLPKTSSFVFECLGISLTDPETGFTPNEGYRIQPGQFNEEYDVLWEEAAASLSLEWAVARHSNWLKWKRGRHYLLEFRDLSASLRGYIVVNRESGLVVDLLARSYDEMEATLRHAVNYLHHNNPSRPLSGINEIKLMQTGVVDKITQTIPCQKINFRFAFVHFTLYPEQDFSDRDLFIMPDD